jgi:hypothetical protein
MVCVSLPKVSKYLQESVENRPCKTGKFSCSSPLKMLKRTAKIIQKTEICRLRAVNYDTKYDIKIHSALKTGANRACSVCFRFKKKLIKAASSL